MVVFMHVATALLSLGVTTLCFFYPSRLSLGVNYGFIAATFLSGMYLVVSQPAHMLHACMMGVVYLLLVATVTIAARVRFVRMKKEGSRT